MDVLFFQLLNNSSCGLECGN